MQSTRHTFLESCFVSVELPPRFGLLVGCSSLLMYLGALALVMFLFVLLVSLDNESTNLTRCNITKNIYKRPGLAKPLE